MSLSHTDTLVGAFAAGMVVVAFLLVLLSRRAVARRLASLTTRMGESDLQFGGRAGLETGLAKLEHVVDSTVAVASEASSARSLMEAALDAVPQGVVVANDQGIVIFQNPPAIALLGPEGAEAHARDTVAGLLRSAAEGRSQEASIDIEGPPARKLGIQAQALHDDQRTLGAVVVIEDFSERRKLESVRRDFVDNIGHELKRPVGALSLLAETLAAEDDPAIVARLSRRLQNEAQRVSRVVDDLLHLSKMDVRASAQEKGMTVNFGEPPQRLSVMGDRRLLVSAVFNLLDNAVKYSPAGSVVEVRGRRDAQWVELRVRDHGIGIAEGDCERIFERFYRVEGARVRHLGGTGLGLAIVRHVAGSNHGEVRVESEPGQGSTFVLRLPSGPSLGATAGSAAPAPSADPTQPAQTG